MFLGSPDDEEEEIFPVGMGQGCPSRLDDSNQWWAAIGWQDDTCFLSPMDGRNPEWTYPGEVRSATFCGPRGLELPLDA